MSFIKKMLVNCTEKVHFGVQIKLEMLRCLRSIISIPMVLLNCF